MSRNDSEGRYFFISAPLGSMLTTEGMRGRDGSSEGIPNQFVSSAAEGLIAVCSMKKRNAQVTDGTAATVSQGGFGRASHRWAAIPIRNAGPIPAIHQQGFQLPLTWAHSGCAARIHRLCIGIPLPVRVSAKSTASSELDSKKARCARIISNL